jgi:AbrB family looped-hinge helix DNA binding protein
MRITSKGQVTIPIEIRERFGFLPDSEVDFVVEGQTVCLVRARSEAEGRGARVVSRLRGAGSGRLSTDEIMRLTRG